MKQIKRVSLILLVSLSGFAGTFTTIHARIESDKKASISTPKYKRWLVYAEADLIIAKAVLDLPDLCIVGVLYHSQQCAEKALKAFLVFHQTSFKKTHDLVELVKACVNPK